MNVRCALPVTPGRRVSPDSAWPLRRANGRPFHETAAKENEESADVRR